MGVLVRVVPTVAVDTRCARAKRERFPDGARTGGRFRGASCLQYGGCGEREIFRAGRSRGGPEPVPRERGPLCPPNGRSSEDPRTDGPPIRVDRKSQSAHTQTSRGKGPGPAPRGGGPLCPLRWAFIRRHAHRRATKQFGPEKSLVMQHKKIARSTAQPHRQVSFLEGDLFDRPAFAAKRRPQGGATHKQPCTTTGFADVGIAETGLVDRSAHTTT